MRANFDFTEKETAILRAINTDDFYSEAIAMADEDDYYRPKGREDGTWSYIYAAFLEDYAKKSGFDMKVARGVLSSLIKKGVVVFVDNGGYDKWEGRNEDLYLVMIEAVNSVLENEEEKKSWSADLINSDNADEVIYTKSEEVKYKEREAKFKEASAEVDKLKGAIEMVSIHYKGDEDVEGMLTVALENAKIDMMIAYAEWKDVDNAETIRENFMKLKDSKGLTTS